MLLDVYRSCLEGFRKTPEEAKKLIEVGDSDPPASLTPAELAAWTMVANLILNLDETVTKG